MKYFKTISISQQWEHLKCSSKTERERMRERGRFHIFSNMNCTSRELTCPPHHKNLGSTPSLLSHSWLKWWLDHLDTQTELIWLLYDPQTPSSDTTHCPRLWLQTSKHTNKSIEEIYPCVKILTGVPFILRSLNVRTQNYQWLKKSEKIMYVQVAMINIS